MDMRCCLLHFSSFYRNCHLFLVCLSINHSYENFTSDYSLSFVWQSFVEKLNRSSFALFFFIVSICVDMDPGDLAICIRRNANGAMQMAQRKWRVRRLGLGLGSGLGKQIKL